MKRQTVNEIRGLYSIRGFLLYFYCIKLNTDVHTRLGCYTTLIHCTRIFCKDYRACILTIIFIEISNHITYYSVAIFHMTIIIIIIIVVVVVAIIRLSHLTAWLVCDVLIDDAI